MSTNILIKLSRLSAIILLANLLAVMTVGANTVLAHRALSVPAAAGSPATLTPLDPAKLSFREIIGGLTNPIFVNNAGDGSGRIFIVEQAGYIRILKNGSLLATPFLDIHTLVKSGGEQGLLALAFHPSYDTNGAFFVAYTAPRSGDATGSNLILERFSVSANNPDLADPASGVILLTVSHPVNSNHNGGTLAFGEDGYLYWSTGDGGGGGDPANNAQQLNNLLGKILRIDVNSGSPYAIPISNPFYSSADPNIKKEIWAYGLRNPWRMSFDRLTHDLYIGDVGQSVREEVDFQPAVSTGGENYGWRVMEGSLCYNPSSGCDPSGKVPPVAEYDHTLGCSITGGYVYRGTNFPSLTGYYFYGDFCSGRLFSLYYDAALGWKSVQLVDTAFRIATFGEDEQGELYLIDRNTGKLYNIQYQDAPAVASVTPANTSPTNASSVDFTVTFSEPVTGVDMTGPQFNDFVLTTGSGISGASVTGVSGSGAIYTVTVNTGTGDGSVRLDVVDNDTIQDASGLKLGGTGSSNGNFNTGRTYTMDRTAPTTSAINRAGSNPATTSTVNFTVTFSEPVTGVEAVAPFNDFALTTSGISGASVGGVSGSGAVYTVTVNTGANDGTLRLDIPATATITDLAGNMLSGLPFTAGDTYTINKPPPAVVLTAPIGDIGAEYNPNYMWNKVATATHYHLYISGPMGLVLDQWFEASSICDVTTCSVTPGPTYTLGGGNYAWYVQTYNTVGYGPWSNTDANGVVQPTNFSAAIPTPPAAAVLTSPKGDIGANYNPTFTWGKVDTATYYRLYVGGSAGAVLDQWYKAADFCNATACSVPGPQLAGGAYVWYVQTYNPAGVGPWSNNAQPTSFNTSTTPPIAASLTAPIGDIGTNFYPAYTWNKVDTATYYRLYVSGPGGVILDQWFKASDICPDTTCSVPSPRLGMGAYAWYVQTYNPAGVGPWSNNTQPTNFNTTAPALPSAAVLTSPKGDIGTDYSPTFLWNKVDGALYYRFYLSGPAGVVLDKWFEASAICNTACSVPGPQLAGGAYTWYIQTWNPAGVGPWSNTDANGVIQPTNFNTTATPPTAAVLTAPKGDIGINYSPAFTWGRVTGATYYRLYVSGPAGVALDQWYQASSICDTSNCSVTGPTLAGGAYVWYVQTYSPAGFGPWSNNAQPTNFNTTIPALPSASVLTAPIGNIGTNYYPFYTWNKVSTASWYRLYVSGPAGVVLDQWYPSANICNVTTCSVISPTLGGGAYVWYVQTYNQSGFGPWSNNTQPTNFNTTTPTIPAGAVLTAPTGTITTLTPTFTWNKVSMATWYRLYIKGPYGLVKDQWYQASNICDATTCSVVSPALASGDHIWWVQTYNVAGYGPWKKGNFKVSP